MRIHLNFCHICSVFLMLLTFLGSFLFLAPTRALPFYITLSSWYIREKETSLTYFFTFLLGFSQYDRSHLTGTHDCISQIREDVFLRNFQTYFCNFQPSCLTKLHLAGTCLQLPSVLLAIPRPTWHQMGKLHLSIYRLRNRCVFS